MMKSLSLRSSISWTPLHHTLCKIEEDHEMWVPYVHLEVVFFKFYSSLSDELLVLLEESAAVCKVL